MIASSPDVPHQAAGRSGAAVMPVMWVWIDQDCCTGAGLCVDHCPELFIVLDDGIGYVHDGCWRSGIRIPSLPPHRYEQAAVDSADGDPASSEAYDGDRWAERS